MFENKFSEVGMCVHTDCNITSWSLAMHVKSKFACANKVLMHAVRSFADTKAKASSSPGFLHLYNRTKQHSPLARDASLGPVLAGKAHAVAPDGKALSS